MAVDQMADMGVKWVLLGHSERRGEFGLPTPKARTMLHHMLPSYHPSGLATPKERSNATY